MIFHGDPSFTSEVWAVYPQNVSWPFVFIFWVVKLVLEKAEEPELKLPTSAGSWKKQESSRKTSIFALFDYAKAFDCVDHNKLWKILKEMGIPDHLTGLLRNLHAIQKQQLELHMEQQTGSK